MDVLLYAQVYVYNVEIVIWAIFLPSFDTSQSSPNYNFRMFRELGYNFLNKIFSKQLIVDMNLKRPSSSNHFPVAHLEYNKNTAANSCVQKFLLT